MHAAPAKTSLGQPEPEVPILTGTRRAKTQAVQRLPRHHVLETRHQPIPFNKGPFSHPSVDRRGRNKIAKAFQVGTAQGNSAACPGSSFTGRGSYQACGTI